VQLTAVYRKILEWHFTHSDAVMSTKVAGS